MPFSLPPSPCDPCLPFLCSLLGLRVFSLCLSDTTGAASGGVVSSVMPTGSSASDGPSPQSRFVVYDRYAAEGVNVATAPRPAEPRPGRLLVEVKACGVNPVDAKYCVGDKLPEFLPESWRRWCVDGKGAGFDFAGIVVGVPSAPPETGSGGGTSESDFVVGDLVFGSMPPMEASFAEFVEVPLHQVAKMPRKLAAGPGGEPRFAQAAALPLVGTTAVQALKHRHGLTAGQRILIVGASGGVGTVAVQIARYLVGAGGHVAAICSSRNFELVRRLGADKAFDYTRGLDTLVEELKAEYGAGSGGRPYFDLVLDCVSSLEEKDRVFDYNPRIHASGLLKTELNAPLTSKSNYITIGGPTSDWARAMLRRSWLGWNWFSVNHELFWIAFPHSAGVLQELAAAVDEDALHAEIDEVPVKRFEDVEPVREAFRRLHGRRVQGKLVLVL
eukprot:Hpha_TRINITY_DN8389_c0_g1::TRINITY_DN8389_c0_g1_i2::g.154272::m.154272